MCFIKFILTREYLRLPCSKSLVLIEKRPLLVKCKLCGDMISGDVDSIAHSPDS